MNSYIEGLQSFVVTWSYLMRVSHSADGKVENSLNFEIFLTLHRSPVITEQIRLGAPYLFRYATYPYPPAL